MEYLEALGYTPLEAIRAATSTAAEAIGRGKERGRIAPGYAADVLIVVGNPAQGVGVLRDPRRIWRTYRRGRPVELHTVRADLSRRIASVDFDPRSWLPRSFDALQAAA
jgi:imidazolonepropionase-like amidohydrolase